MNLRNLACAFLALSSLTAFAADEATYQVPVARLQGNLDCTIGLDDMSFDCTLHAAGKASMNVDMRAMNNKAGDVLGFYGRDTLVENGVSYTLVVMADSTQTIKGMTMATGVETATGIHASMVSMASNDLQAFNLSPLNVDMGDGSNVKINFGFSVYGKAQAAIMQSANSADLIETLIDRVRPYVLSLRK